MMMMVQFDKVTDEELKYTFALSISERREEEELKE